MFSRIFRSVASNRAYLTQLEKEIIASTRAVLGSDAYIATGKEIASFTKGFRGQQGAATAAVAPKSLNDLYQLIMCYNDLGVGYILQGANTALKGQGTPHGTAETPVVIIKTIELKDFKIFAYPDNPEYAVIVVEPGLSLQALEVVLDDMGYDLPHKIGSHAMGNTIGASAATGCGGVRVDNCSGRVPATLTGNAAVVTLGAEGTIYNGILPRTNSGQALLDDLDAGKFNMEDLDLPDPGGIKKFMQRLFVPKSYPITNHLDNNPFSGQGAEGTLAIARLMYLVRKKPKAIKTWVLLFAALSRKEAFYQEVVFARGSEHPDSLPIVCESMSEALLEAMVRKGVSYPIPAFLALASGRFTRYYLALLACRKIMIGLCPRLYLRLEALLGRGLSKLLTPKEVYAGGFEEMLLLRIADREGCLENIAEFDRRLYDFAQKHQGAIRILELAPGSLDERLLIEIRNAAALATLTIAERDRGVLFAFDDAIMPGMMTEHYCDLLAERLTAVFPDLVLQKYLYAHDLKQISHNDWVVSFKDGRQLSAADIHKINAIQHEVILEAGGVPHAEHGIGDHAETDLSLEDLINLVKLRLLNDVRGLANPGGGFARAFAKAIKDPVIVTAAIQRAHEDLQRESERGTLLMLLGKPTLSQLQVRLEKNVAILFGEMIGVENMDLAKAFGLLD